MILVENKLGNVEDAVWSERLHEWRVDRLVLEQWEAPKNRLRKSSEGGTELAISLPRAEQLHDGDILHADEEARVLVVAQVVLKDVLVIELEGLETLSPAQLLQVSFQLGHALGNQHWPGVIKGSTVYVPLSVDQKVMASVMRTHAFSHVRTRFAPGAEVLPQLDPREARLLFGGADAVPHHHHNPFVVEPGHLDADFHDHEHSGGGTHPHTHTDEHSHTHTHSHDHADGHGHSHGPKGAPS